MGTHQWEREAQIYDTARKGEVKVTFRRPLQLVKVMFFRQGQIYLAERVM